MTTETDQTQTLADLIRAIGRLEGSAATKSDLAELTTDIHELRSEIKSLRTDVDGLHKWSASAVGILIALLITLLGGLGFMGATLLDHAAQIGELRGANGRTSN